MTAPIQNSCYFYPATFLEISNIIRGIKNKGNKLLDIHPIIIKNNIVFFGTHLRDLYNMSLTVNVFPDMCKIGRVAPAHKSGSFDVLDNYRPISVLPTFSKIFEKLTFTRMDNFISRYNILTSCQFGFRAGRSTTHAITKLLSYVVDAFHNKEYCVCFFLDLRKAFDTVHHQILLKKLKHYGFRGHCYDYLKSYFENRKQYVYLDDYKSELLTLRNGVPQGSVLGPLCFSLYINDLPEAVDAHTILFADDAAFIITGRSWKEVLNKIDKMFTDLMTYLNVNMLVPNSSKCKLMKFSTRPTQNLPELTFANEVIEWVDQFKYLGLIITNRLCFSSHINRVALNVSRITGIFTNIRTVVPYHILTKLYYALVYPHLINHVIIWGSAPTCHLKTLSTRLNNLLRVMLGVRWLNYRPVVATRDMYKNNNFLTIENIFKLTLYKFLRQLLDGQLPDLFSTLLEAHISHHNYGTRGCGGFRHPALRCEVERRFLPHQLVLLYDSVPENFFNLHIITSLKRFRLQLLENQ